MAKAVFLDYSSLAPDDLDVSQLLEELPGLVLRDATSSVDIDRVIKGCEVIITNKVRLSKQVLSNASSLQLICSAATGVDHIDISAATALQQPVCNVRDYGSDSVAEHVFSLLLSLQRNITAYRRYVTSGGWQNSDSFCGLDYPITELNGLTLGIIGYGSLGMRTANIAKCFGMQVLLSQRPGDTETRSGRVTLDELYRQSDVISLHCPLTTETRNLINEAVFKKMKSTAVLINTARGGIINEADLVDALKSGEIAAAGIDVIETEPPDEGSILPKQDIDNLLVTPHIAWASQNARQNVINQLCKIISAWKHNELYNQVNHAVSV